MEYQGKQLQKHDWSNEHSGRRLKFQMSPQSFYKLFADIGRRQMAENPQPSLAAKVEYNSGLQHEQAIEALKHYKEEKGVDYELSEVLSASRAVFSGSHGFHLNFEAIPNYGIDRSPSPKHFFAELFWFHQGPKAGSYRVTICTILDPSSSDVIKGCPDCTEEVLHPKRASFFCCHTDPLQTDAICQACRRP